MSENKTAQIDEELEISILLENFNYSSTRDDRTEQSIVLKFFGKIREKARMFAHSFRAKKQGGLFSAIADDEDEQSSVPKFFGRAKEKDRLLDRLGQGKNRRGSFLIAGYRGVGKTRFVNEVLRKYEKVNGDFIEVRVNLGNDGDLTSKSVLFNMVYLLNNSVRSRWQVKFLKLLFGNIIRSLSLGAVLLFPVFAADKFNLIHSLYTDWWIAILLFFCVPIWVLMHYGEFPFFRDWKAFIKLKKLQQQIYSTIDDHAEIKSNYFGISRKRVSGPLTINQIEAQLKDILEILRDEDVIFIFDELDKLSGRASDKTDNDHDLVKESKLRKQQVDSILGDLKNLITDSDARYIFIAGRDMYDAYLSERGSSNSLYESLFNDHIYIPSLLTDRSNGEIYLLDSMIEAFVVSNLIPREQIKKILVKKEQEAKKRSHKFTGDLSHLKLSDYVDYQMKSKESSIRQGMAWPSTDEDEELSRLIKEEKEDLKK